jgi:transcriptional activator of comK gene/basic membrane protein A
LVYLRNNNFFSTFLAGFSTKCAEVCEFILFPVERSYVMANFDKRFPMVFGGLVAGLLLLITSQFLLSLQQIRQANHSEANLPRIALLLEGPTYDQGWNSSAFESLQELHKTYGFPLKIASNLKAEEITAVAEAYAATGYDLIIGHGVIFSEPFSRIARFYPKTRFVSFNGETAHPNQSTVRFDMKPAGYIVGKLAALMSKSHKVGYIVIDKPPEYAQVEGFKQGVKAADPHAVVEVAKVPDFNDIPAALSATRRLIEHGVDVIYTTGDSFNLAVITEAQKSDIYAIGYISDQRYIAPNHVLASLVQDVSSVYRLLFKNYFNGTRPSGKVTYGIAEGVNYLSPFGPMVPESVREEINKELRTLMKSH